MNAELNLEQWALVIEALDFTTEDGLNPAYDEDRMALSKMIKEKMMREYNVIIEIGGVEPWGKPSFRIRHLDL